MALQQEEVAHLRSSTNELHRRAARVPAQHRPKVPDVHLMGEVDDHCIAAGVVASDSADSQSEDEGLAVKGKKARQGKGTGVGAEEAGWKKRRKAVTRRRYLHNDQIAIFPCGIVQGRTAFYRAEGVRAMKVSSTSWPIDRTTDRRRSRVCRVS